jgi:prophage tail gpP-like protein
MALLENIKDELDDVKVLLTSQGVVYDSWTDLTINKSIEQLCGTFSISMVDKWRQFSLPWFLTPGQPVVISIGAQPVLTGYIDNLDVAVKNDDRTVTISGRDVTGDLIDSSAVTEPAEFKLLDIVTLANKFTLPFGIAATADTDIGKPFEKFTVKQGETIFELLQRAAELRGLFLHSTEVGGLLITNRASVASQLRAVTPLVQGVNILEAAAVYDNTDRYQTYIVKGQSAGSDVFNGLNATAAIGTATDTAILRPRQKTVIANGSADIDAAQRRANWEATSRAAKSVDITVTTQGWRQGERGPLWRPNLIVAVDAGFIGQAAKELLISSVQFSKTIGGGTVTTMKLTREDAYKPNQPVLTQATDPASVLGWQGSVFSILGG